MAKSRKPRPRGRPFKKGQSGNPRGRPKGSKNRPAELSIEQEVERLTKRGIELVLLDQYEEARTAFEKSFLLSWGSQGRAEGPEEVRHSARRSVDYFRAQFEKEKKIDRLCIHYEDVDANFLEYLGLSADAPWDDFLAFYIEDDGDIDEERVAGDLFGYPPMQVALANAAAESGVLVPVID